MNKIIKCPIFTEQDYLQMKEDAEKDMKKISGKFIDITPDGKLSENTVKKFNLSRQWIMEIS